MKKKHIDETIELKNQLARALADYDNLRKRSQQAEEEIVKFANLKLIIKLLPVLDMLYDAQKHLNDSGLAICINEFEDVFVQEEVEKIDVKVNDKFDEKIHEAIETKEGKADQKGKIESIALVGWRYKAGPVIRHAKVVVYN